MNPKKNRASKAVAIAGCVATLFLCGNAMAVITFDDLPGFAVPNGYQGFNWNGFFAIDGDNPANNASGYHAGVVSPHNVAFNGFGNPAIVSDTLFNLNSGYFTAAWNDNLQVQVIGRLLGVDVYNNTYVLSATAPTFIAFNYLGIDEVKFISSGGTHHSGYSGGSGEIFAMDNLDISAVPEPSTWYAGIGVSMALLSAFVRRTRK
ncbi:MAG: PEP-CTERM sorting domain-containing protein [Verrucomicrobia bacterium]|nr:MAG: PEP-CTERM sorting domain-containing protein [Verrucomicrobiota bacterium]